MFGEEIDVVGDNHQIADAELRVHTACGVAHEERFHPQLIHHPHGESGFLHAVALVEVETALHRHHILIAQIAENQSTAMSFHGRNGEVRDFGIGDSNFHVDVFHQFSQSCAQDDGSFGHIAHFFLNIRGGFTDEL